MIFHHHDQLPFGRKFVRINPFIRSALVVMVLVCLHSIFVDALSLGCSKFPSTQVFNKQGPGDSPSYPTIRTDKTLRYSSPLRMNGAGDDDTASPFFAKKEPDENANEKDSSNSCSNDTPSPFFAEREDSFQIESLSGDESSPFFGTKEEQLEILGESLELAKPETHEDKLPSPFFASKENQLQNLRESLSVEHIESQKEPEKSSHDVSKSPFFALEEDQLQLLKEPLNLDDNRATGEDLGKVRSNASDFSSPFFGKKEVETPLVPIDDIPINSEFIIESQGESERLGSGSQFTKDKYKELIKSFKRPGDDTSERFENTMKTALNVIKDLPSNVEKAVDTSQKIFQDVQDVTRKVNEVTRQTVEKTQETAKDVQDFSRKIQESLDSTKQVVEGKLEETQAVIKDVQDSLDDTKQIVEEQLERTQGVVKDVKGFSSKISESEAASKAKVLLQLEPPKTLTEEALDLAGKATIASAKLTLWGTKRVGSLALKGTKSIYNNTIGPEVEQVWNEQIESLNDSVGKATGVWNDQVESLNDSVEKATGALNERVESINSSVEKAALYVKDTPSRVKSTVTESINEDKKSKRNTAASDVQIQSSSTTGEAATISRSTKGRNQQEELNKELDEAQKLVREISQSLDVVERSMNITRIEIEEHSKETVEANMVTDANIEANELEDKIDETPFQAIEGEAHDETKKKADKKKKTGMRKVLSRFKPSFKTAKTQDELDDEIQKAESLAKEIADALDMAEEALSRTSEDLQSIEKEIDEWSENSS